MASVRLATVKSSESDEWYRVGTSGPICRMMFSASTVFMEPGGPLIMDSEPRRNEILCSPKMGQGSGRGSPADTPLATVLCKVRTNSCLSSPVRSVLAVSTPSPTIRPDDQIVITELVTVGAMRLACIDGLRAFTSEDILLLGDEIGRAHV